jgi:hypothetical protein
MEKVTTDLSKIFKKGKDFELKDIDFGSEKFSKEIKEIKLIQNKIRKSTEVDMSKLSKIVFKI